MLVKSCQVTNEFSNPILKVHQENTSAYLQMPDERDVLFCQMSRPN